MWNLPADTQQTLRRRIERGIVTWYIRQRVLNKSIYISEIELLMLAHDMEDVLSLTLREELLSSSPDALPPLSRET